jgi:ABC-type Mn2+/Zn2+ transport system permease subunit
MNDLLAPFQLPFMQHGALAAVLVGTTCAVLGCYVVLRRMAFIGDAIAHTTLPGVVVAYVYGFNLFIGALVAGLVTAIGIGWLSRREEVREDTAIGVLFTAMFALGILIMSRTRNNFRDFSHMLIGNLLAVSTSDLISITLIAAAVLITLALFHKELELTSVDPTYARAVGLRADWMRNLLLILLSLAIVVGIQAVGVIMISGLLITPAAAASLLTRSLPRMMLLAIFIAVSSGIAGLYESLKWDVQPGPAIVITSAGWFALIYLSRQIARRKILPSR